MPSMLPGERKTQGFRILRDFPRTFISCWRSTIRRPTIKFGVELAQGAGRGGAGCCVCVCVGGRGWPWSESCVNGGSTQHLLHRGLPRLKQKSLYLPLCFINGHSGSCRPLRCIKEHPRSHICSPRTHLSLYATENCYWTAGAPLQDLWNHKTSLSSSPFSFKLSLSLPLSLSIGIMLSFRNLIYSIHWSCLQGKKSPFLRFSWMAGLLRWSIQFEESSFAQQSVLAGLKWGFSIWSWQAFWQ